MSEENTQKRAARPALIAETEQQRGGLRLLSSRPRLAVVAVLLMVGAGPSIGWILVAATPAAAAARHQLGQRTDGGIATNFAGRIAAAD